MEKPNTSLAGHGYFAAALMVAVAHAVVGWLGAEVPHYAVVFFCLSLLTLMFTVLAVREFGGSTGRQVGLGIMAMFGLVNVIVVIVAWVAYSVSERKSRSESGAAGV